MPKEKNVCPYCNKADFIPRIVYAHTDAYGEGVKNFCCIHCDKVVAIMCRRIVVLTDPRKTNRESDW